MIRPVVLAFVLIAAVSTAARADEADNFTCRGRLTSDALPALDGWVNARIQEAIDGANGRGPGRCDLACLQHELEDAVGASVRKATLVPGSRFVKWMAKQPAIERCHLAFKDTIYGARAYDQPWRWPFLGRIIFVADSIDLGGRTVGIDKVDHFIREGLEHWRHVQQRGWTVEASMAHEVGAPGKRLQWTEYGVKGQSLTGVFAYADLAAGYFGYRFWRDLLAIDQPASFVARDAATGRYAARRPFTFAGYVNDAWDETINCSTFVPKIGREVAAALKARSMTCGGPAAAGLATLPDAKLYINPLLVSHEAMKIMKDVRVGFDRGTRSITTPKNSFMPFMASCETSRYFLSMAPTISLCFSMSCRMPISASARSASSPARSNGFVSAVPWSSM
jgi:hypothetical protein